MYQKIPVSRLIWHRNSETEFHSVLQHQFDPETRVNFGVDPLRNEGSREPITVLSRGVPNLTPGVKEWPTTNLRRESRNGTSGESYNRMSFRWPAVYLLVLPDELCVASIQHSTREFSLYWEWKQHKTLPSPNVFPYLSSFVRTNPSKISYGWYKESV